MNDIAVRTEKKDQIISCINNLNYKSISRIFNVSIPYIYRLKNLHDIPTLKHKNDNMNKKKFNYFKITLMKNIILDYFNITNDELMGKSKRREYVIPRMFFTHYLIIKTPLNWQELGDQTGRDHATAIHYVKKMEMELLYKDTRKIKQELDEIIL